MISISKISLQKALSIVSFTVGTILASICLLFIEPIGEIHETAIALTSEFLILSGACLGVSVSVDLKLKKFKANMAKKYGCSDEEIDLER